MKELLKLPVVLLSFIDSIVASVARAWMHRERVIHHSVLNEGTTPRYRPPQGRPRRRR